MASRCLDTISSMVLFEYALGAVLFATFAVVAVVFNYSGGEPARKVAFRPHTRETPARLVCAQGLFALRARRLHDLLARVPPGRRFSPCWHCSLWQQYSRLWLYPLKGLPRFIGELRGVNSSPRARSSLAIADRSPSSTRPIAGVPRLLDQVGVELDRQALPPRGFRLWLWLTRALNSPLTKSRPPDSV